MNTLKTYTDKEIEEMSYNELKNKFKEIQDIAKDGNEVIRLLDKMKRKYKLALFMVIRNSSVMPKGLALNKSDREINKMSYETLCEVLTMIDYNIADKLYKEGKECFKERKNK